MSRFSICGTVIDVLRQKLARFQVPIFFLLAYADGDEAGMVDCAKFFVVIAIANGLVDLLRQWRRHHG